MFISFSWSICSFSTELCTTNLSNHCHLYYILLILIHTVNVFLWRDIWNSDVVICLSFNIIYHEAKKKTHNSLDIYLPGIYMYKIFMQSKLSILKYLHWNHLVCCFNCFLVIIINYNTN